MMKRTSGFTLIELIIAITLIGLLSLSFYHIDYFARFHASNSNRKSRLQSDVSLILEQIAKDAVGAIGARVVVPGYPPTVEVIDPGGVIVLRIWVDGNPYVNDSDPGYDSDDYPPNGRREDLLVCPQCDRTVGFTFYNYQVAYYPYCRGPRCTEIAGYVGPEILSKHIVSFTAALVNNNIDLYTSARWKPAEAASIENPTVTMRSRLSMPAVSNR